MRSQRQAPLSEPGQSCSRGVKLGLALLALVLLPPRSPAKQQPHDQDGRPAGRTTDQSHSSKRTGEPKRTSNSPSDQVSPAPVPEAPDDHGKDANRVAAQKAIDSLDAAITATAPSSGNLANLRKRKEELSTRLERAADELSLCDIAQTATTLTMEVWRLRNAAVGKNRDRSLQPDGDPRQAPTEDQRRKGSAALAVSLIALLASISAAIIGPWLTTRTLKKAGLL